MEVKFFRFFETKEIAFYKLFGMQLSYLQMLQVATHIVHI